MNSRRGYSLQGTRIVYVFLNGFAALPVASEYVPDTHSPELSQDPTRNFHQHAGGELSMIGCTAPFSAIIDDTSTHLQEILMLARSVCLSAGRVTSNSAIVIDRSDY
jgi:hypothetical protein